MYDELSVVAYGRASYKFSLLEKHQQLKNVCCCLIMEIRVHPPYKASMAQKSLFKYPNMCRLSIHAIQAPLRCLARINLKNLYQ